MAGSLGETCLHKCSICWSKCTSNDCASSGNLCTLSISTSAMAHKEMSSLKSLVVNKGSSNLIVTIRMSRAVRIALDTKQRSHVRYACLKRDSLHKRVQGPLEGGCKRLWLQALISSLEFRHHLIMIFRTQRLFSSYFV